MFFLRRFTMSNDVALQHDGVCLGERDRKQKTVLVDIFSHRPIFKPTMFFLIQRKRWKNSHSWLFKPANWNIGKQKNCSPFGPCVMDWGWSCFFVFFIICIPLHASSTNAPLHTLTHTHTYTHIRAHMCTHTHSRTQTHDALDDVPFWLYVGILIRVTWRLWHEWMSHGTHINESITLDWVMAYT